MIPVGAPRSSATNALTDGAPVTISRARASDDPVGLCGQAPSDDLSFADLLVEAGIDSISVNPDSIGAVRERVYLAEKRYGGGPSERPIRTTASTSASKSSSRER